jgi:hypothetical protein
MSTKIYCKAVEEHKVNGKWVLVDDNHNNLSREISQEEYHNIVSNETIALFRAFGGTETITLRCKGNVARLISTSPDKQIRVIYTFTFDEVA